MIDWVAVLVVAKHLHDEPYMNRQNIGIGIESQIDERRRVVAGVYQNTNDKTAVYVGASYGWQSGPWRASVTGGLVTGYRWPVLFVPAVSYEGERFGMNVLFMPNPKVPGRSAVGLQIKWRVGQ